MNLTYESYLTLEEFLNLFFLLNLPSQKTYISYFTGNEKFTRLVEYKKFTKQNMMRTQL